jgi:hypothetical protein
MRPIRAPGVGLHGSRGLLHGSLLHVGSACTGAPHSAVYLDCSAAVETLFSCLVGLNVCSSRLRTHKLNGVFAGTGRWELAQLTGFGCI